MRFITDHKESFLEIVSTDWKPQAELIFIKERGKERKKEIINLEEFISIKGEKALGNKLTSRKVKEITLLEPLPYVEEVQTVKTQEIELNIINDSEDDKEGQITLKL